MSESVAPDLRHPLVRSKNDSHMKSRTVQVVGTIVMVVVAIGLGSGCSGESDSGDDDARPTVVASFAPLAWAAERIGGDAIDVVDLTPPGVEPHDLELSPSQIAAVGEARLAIVVGGGFQPAVEDAAAGLGDDALVLLDRIDLGDGAGDDHVDEHADDHPGDDADDEADDHADAADDGHGHGEIDPHIWLDPVLMVDVVEVMRDEIAKRVPADAERIRTNADALVGELVALDRDARDVLAACIRRELVTAHDAFGRLAARYDLTAIPIAGISPDVEPSPDRLAELSELAREHGVTTIFAEVLVSPEIAEALAREAGGLEVARLDPIEGFTDEQREAGVTYLDVMRDNLDAISAGLDCA